MITSKQLKSAQARYERASRHARKERDHLILQALAEGWTQRQVAAATGLTHGRVAQIALGGSSGEQVEHQPDRRDNRHHHPNDMDDGGQWRD